MVLPCLIALPCLHNATFQFNIPLADSLLATFEAPGMYGRHIGWISKTLSEIGRCTTKNYSLSNA
jgi:hypothetical protein